MKTWYQTREGSNLQHKSQPIQNGKRIFLTEAQAKLHGDAIEKSEAPTTADESALIAEYDEWRATTSVKPTDKPKEEVKSKK